MEDVLLVHGSFPVDIEPVDLGIQLNAHIALILIRQHNYHAVTHKLFVGNRQIERVDLVGQSLEVPILIQRVGTNGDVTQLSIPVVAPGKDTTIGGNGGGQTVLASPETDILSMASIAIYPNHRGNGRSLVCHGGIRLPCFTSIHIVKAGGVAVGQPRSTVTGQFSTIACALLTGVVHTSGKNIAILTQRQGEPHPGWSNR